MVSFAFLSFLLKVFAEVLEAVDSAGFLEHGLLELLEIDPVNQMPLHLR
jgi:hypothetical protein